MFLGHLKNSRADYSVAIRSLAAYCADLATDPRRLVAKALSMARFPITVGLGYLSYCRSLVRKQTDFVQEQWKGLQDLPSATRIAVFSHYDTQGKLHDFVVHYLHQLVDAGFTVVFVSNAPHLTEETVSRLRPLCGLILRRANVGYDFGGYKDGIAMIPDLRALETLLLVNDSAYGPFHPLKEIVARMDSSADVWGITDNSERHYHLQSYFLLFNRTALQSTCFAHYWARLRYVNSKYQIIAAGEIGLSKRLGAGGLRCQALFPSRTAAVTLERLLRDDKSPRLEALDPAQRVFLHRVAFALHRGRPLNSTHFFWDYLITRMGCPFLKRELLRDNPEHVPFIRNWEQLVSSASAYDTSLITRHLDLTMENRPLPDPAKPGRPYQSWFE